MPFRFPLAPVLQVRESLEKREERALQSIQLELARVAQQIEEISAAIQESHEARERALKEPIQASRLQMHLAETQAAVERKKSLLRDLQSLKQQRDQQLKAYHAAHRDRETLSDMLEKQRDAYEQEQARTQQKNIDDVFIARRQRS